MPGGGGGGGEKDVAGLGGRPPAESDGRRGDGRDGAARGEDPRALRDRRFVQREYRPRVAEGIRQIDHITAELDRRLHERGRPLLERPGGVDDHIAWAEAGHDRARVGDIEAQLATRARRHNGRDPNRGEASCDHATEEARANDHDASHRSFTARYRHHGQKSAKSTAVAPAVISGTFASAPTLSRMPAVHMTAAHARSAPRSGVASVRPMPQIVYRPFATPPVSANANGDIARYVSIPPRMRMSSAVTSATSPRPPKMSGRDEPLIRARHHQ